MRRSVDEIDCAFHGLTISCLALVFGLPLWRDAASWVILIEESGSRVQGRVTLAVTQILRRFVDKIWVALGGRRHLVEPAQIGQGPHDCGLVSLYQVVPWIPEDRIVEAFQYCTDAWPYGGITNKEFQIAVKYLKVDAHYSDEEETLGSLLDRKPVRCIALLPYHYVGILNGKVAGHEPGIDRSTTVYCHWTFDSPQLLSVASGRRKSGGTT
jgi:hypothetical protein